MADERDRLSEASEERIRSAMRAGLDNVYRQLEALMWLRDLLQLQRPLPPLRGWAASPDLLLEVARRIIDTHPAAIVEMGSGASTVALAAALRRAGSGRLVSLEHDPEFAQRTRAELDSHGLSDVASVIDAPLGEVMIEGQARLWYTVPLEQLPPLIDIVFVDGPPSGVAPRARYPALPFLADRLAATAAIYLDDGVYRDVKDIAALWQQAHPEFTIREIPSEKDCLVLTRSS